MIVSYELRGISVNDSLHNRYTKKEIFKKTLTEEDRERAKEKYFKDKANSPITSPLQNELSTLIVMSNGKSILENVIGRREVHTKPRTLQKKIELMNKAGLEEYETDVYIRRIKNELDRKEKKKQKRKNRVKDNNSFLERHERNTYKERAILKSLGITHTELGKLIGPASPLSDGEKAQLLSTGHFVRQETINQRNKPVSYKAIGDVEILEFLDQFRFATLKNLALAMGNVSYMTARGRLTKLRNQGMIAELEVPFAYPVFALTKTGVAYLGSSRKLVQKRQSSPSALTERIYVNNTAACLFKNSVNALNLDDFPYFGREYKGEKVQGEDMVSEFDIISDYNQKLSHLKESFFTKDKYKGESSDRMREQWEILWGRWERDKSLPSPELENPFCYLIFPPKMLITLFTNKYLLPDIVVKRPRKADGSPSNIAVEVERYFRGYQTYLNKIRFYKSDKNIYEKVIFVTSDQTVAKNIKQAAEEEQFERYDIVPVMNGEGITTERNSWLV